MDTSMGHEECMKPNGGDYFYEKESVLDGCLETTIAFDFGCLTQALDTSASVLGAVFL